MCIRDRPGMIMTATLSSETRKESSSADHSWGVSRSAFMSAAVRRSFQDHESTLLKHLLHPRRSQEIDELRGLSWRALAHRNRVSDGLMGIGGECPNGGDM